MHSLKKYLIILFLFFGSIDLVAQTTTIQTVNSSCSGISDGSVVVETNGCNGYFTYKLYWQNPNNGWWVLLAQTTTYISTPQSFPSLLTGNYKIVITSQSSCPVNDEFFVINSISTNSTIVTPVSPTCYGGLDGSITINTSGGSDSFKYTLYWQNPNNGWWVQLAITGSYISIAHMFPNLGSGNYKIEILSLLGCSVPDEFITIYDPPQIIVVANSDQSICNGGVPSNLTAIGTGSGAGSYSWTPQSAFTNPNLQNPIFNGGLNNTGIFTVTFTDNDGCIATDFVVITVNPLPTVTASSSIASPLCDGDALILNGGGATTYTWDNGIVDNIPFNPGTGTVIYTVTGTDGNLCENTATISVTVNPLPTATIAISETVCLGGVVPDLLAYGSLPNWYLDAALTIYVFTGNYFATGETTVGLYTYYVTETLNGCEGPSVPVTLEIYALPIVTATADQTICDGYAPSSLNASSTSAGTYSWVDAADPLGIVLGTGSNFPPPPLTATTTYTVNFTETSSGCTDDDDVTITVNPTPTVILSAAPNPACIGDDVILTASTSIPVNRYRFQYNTGSGWNNLTAPSWGIINPVTYNNITQDTQFKVKVKENNGCNASNWSPTITVPVVTFGSLPIWHN